MCKLPKVNESNSMLLTAEKHKSKLHKILPEAIVMAISTKKKNSDSQWGRRVVGGVKIAAGIQNHVSTVEDSPRVIQNAGRILIHKKKYSYVDTKERDYLGRCKNFCTETQVFI